MVFELARLRALDRPMAGVMDTRGDFIRDQPVADLEKFDREHADVSQCLQHPHRIRFRLALQPGGEIDSRGEGAPQYPRIMAILNERVEAGLSIAVADGGGWDFA